MEEHDKGATMDSERHAWLCRVVDRALDLSAAERTAYLAEVCTHDDLRRNVDRLLAMSSQADADAGPIREAERDVTPSRIGDVFDHLELLAAGSPEPESPRLPKQIGGYRILDLLGAGGMGLVFLAEQDEPVKRQVAVKVVRTSLQSKHLLARFDAERNALARLSHPNVVQLFEASLSEDGFPFFVMENLPSAERLTDYCNARELSLPTRLDLFVQACHGVQHAHQKGVLHRDLKPSNVLVVELEGDTDGASQGTPLPKVIDFGLAEALDDLPLAGSQLSERSERHQVMGTPEYMSPEARFATSDADTRSDVFSLGVMLCELLTGRRPDGPDQLPREIRGDLEWIVLRAIAPAPDERYASVAELAADLQRHLHGYPVAARPTTMGYLPARAYLIKKFVRRHRPSVLAASVVVLALLAGYVARTLEAERANEAARLAQAESQRAQVALAESRELSDFLVQLFKEADPTLHSKTSLTVRELIDRGVRNLSSRFEDQPLTRARFLSLLGSVYNNLALYDVAEPLLREAFELQDRNLGSSHEDLSTTLFRLAHVDHNQGRFKAARDRYARSLEICDETVGRRSRCAADALYSLGRATNSLGSMEEAEQHFRAAMKIQRETLGPDDRSLALTTSALGFLEFQRGRYPSAEELYLESQRIYDKNYPPDHPSQALIKTNLGSLYWKLQRLDEAEELFREAARIQEKTLGPHRRLADTLGNLALVYRGQERYDEAEAVMQRALEIRQKLLGVDHPDIAISLNNVGVFYWSLERYDEAELAYRQALTIQEKALEPGHFHIGHTASNLGLVLWKLGQFAEAENLLRRALTIWQKSLGEEHPATAWPLWGLAGVCQDQGRFEEAEVFYERVLAFRGPKLADDQPPMRDALVDFATLLRATERPERAAEIAGLTFDTVP